MILRENTERPEAVNAASPNSSEVTRNVLHELLDEIDGDPSGSKRVEQIENPFGSGDSGHRIAAIVAESLGVDDTGTESGNENARVK